MPTPAAPPYDDIPPDLTEPVREDEAPPEGVRPSGPSVRRAQPEPQTVRPPEPTPVPPAGPPVIDLAGHSGEADGHDLDQSPLVGVQAVEQLLGGRVIEEREL